MRKSSGIDSVVVFIEVGEDQQIHEPIPRIQAVNSQFAVLLARVEQGLSLNLANGRFLFPLPYSMNLETRVL